MIAATTAAQINSEAAAAQARLRILRRSGGGCGPIESAVPAVQRASYRGVASSWSACNRACSAEWRLDEVRDEEDQHGREHRAPRERQHAAERDQDVERTVFVLGLIGV